jgi:hypothetical protein
MRKVVMFYKPELVGPLLASVIASLLLLLAAFRAPDLARALFVLLFGLACAFNWTTVLETPRVYLDFEPLAVSSTYRDIILGPFLRHMTLFVGTIATCQGLIALGVTVGGIWARVALVGAIVFLVDIAPLGAGSAFPSTLILAAAAGALLTRSRRRVLLTPMWTVLQEAWSRRPVWFLRGRSPVQ